MRRIVFSLMGLSLIMLSSLLHGINWATLLDTELILILLPLWLVYLLMFRRQELRLALAWNQDSETSVQAALATIQDLWRYLWRLLIVLIFCSAMTALGHPDDKLELGRFLSHLLVGTLYVIVIKGLIFLPVELRLVKLSRFVSDAENQDL